MLQQEFRPLKSVRQLLPDGLLDHARPGKSDQRARLGDVQVAQHRETRRHAAGGGVRQHADVRHTGFVQPHQCSRNLGHLHQAHRAFLHARAARRRHDHQRHPPRDGALDRARQLAGDYAARAKACLNGSATGDFGRALMAVPDFILDRDN